MQVHQHRKLRLAVPAIRLHQPSDDIKGIFCAACDKLDLH